MVKTFRQGRASANGVGTSEFRRRLSHYIATVRHGGDYVAIRRNGEDNVYLISQADWDLLGKKIDDLDSGKFDPKLKVRHGGLWELLNWESRRESLSKMLPWRRELQTNPFHDVPDAAGPESTSTAPSKPMTDAMSLVDGALAQLEEIEKVKREPFED